MTQLEFFITTNYYKKTTHMTPPSLSKFQGNNGPWHRMMESGKDT